MSDEIFPPDERAERVKAAFDEVGPQHVSASQIGMYRRCPRQWSYRYVLGLKVPPDAGLIVGSGVHHAAEIGMIHKRDTGENPEADMTATAAAEFMEDELGTGEVRLDAETDPGDLVDKAARIARLWADEAAPAVEPVGVEEQFDVEIAGIPVTGRLDVTTATDVVDWKTSKRSPNADDAAASVQTEIYAHATNRPVRYVYLVDSPRTQKVVPVNIPEEEIARAKSLAVSTIEDTTEGMALGVWPRNRNGWHCSARWCGYFERCMSGKDDGELRDRAAGARAAAGIEW